MNRTPRHSRTAKTIGLPKNMMRQNKKNNLAFILLLLIIQLLVASLVFSVLPSALSVDSLMFVVVVVLVVLFGVFTSGLITAHIFTHLRSGKKSLQRDI